MKGIKALNHPPNWHVHRKKNDGTKLESFLESEPNTIKNKTSLNKGGFNTMKYTRTRSRIYRQNRNIRAYVGSTALRPNEIRMCYIHTEELNITNENHQHLGWEDIGLDSNRQNRNTRGSKRSNHKSHPYSNTTESIDRTEILGHKWVRLYYIRLSSSPTKSTRSIIRTDHTKISPNGGVR